MSASLNFPSLANGTIVSPFSRLRTLLDGVPPGHEHPLDLTLGEPREAMPPFIGAKLAEAEALLAKYPAIRGSDQLRGAIADWISRRYGLAGGIDPAREILPANGSREGLFYAAFPAVARKTFRGRRPAILMCNPYYQAYLGAALATGADPVFLDATEETGHLPDLHALEADGDLLSRTAAIYLCSPANPQGAVADEAYIAHALSLARAHDIMLFFDECYSEIYSDTPPPGALEVAAKTSERFRNLVVFNSLSKRSNLPGLRSGFSAGDCAFLVSLFEVRNLIGPQMPGPVQHASAAAWADEAHVIANRRAYAAKFDVADAVLGTRFGYRRPSGGFFLWLETSQIGDGAHFALTLWKGFGVKVIPGAFLAQTGSRGTNPGAHYVRIALVHDAETIREALERFVHVFA